ncbi:MAG: alcohol dehydrogenase catalytic domain-containing protein [Myxococcales bacterium]|nr:alcohol dehydrogenase catalytic domain-containing protein [Myxococcales bacterium]
MHALILTADGPAAVTDHPEPAVPHGEALIQLRLGGVCATDLELVKGYMGFTGVLGHEWVGEVLHAPNAALVGKRVVGDINAACGACETCLAGRPHHCPTRTVLGIDGRDGAFAERLALPMTNLSLVPDSVSDEAAVFVEPLAAACEILQQVHVRPTDRVVVIGAGRLGQLCARVLALTGAQVDVLSRGASRLALLPAGIGQHALEINPEAAQQLVGADLVVECSGSADGLVTATTLVRPAGTIVMKTTVHNPEAVTPIPWVINEIRLIGSRCGPFEPALRLLASGAVDPTPLITAQFSLREGVTALQAAAQPAHTKVVLTP